MKGFTPHLITPGVIARRLNQPLHRILYVLAKRSHIRPLARAGRLRLYNQAAIEEVRLELEAIDQRRKAVNHG